VIFRQYHKAAAHASVNPVGAEQAPNSSLWVAFKPRQWRTIWYKEEDKIAQEHFAAETAQAMSNSES
jgi:hypothetical protein